MGNRIIFEKRRNLLKVFQTLRSIINVQRLVNGFNQRINNRKM